MNLEKISKGKYEIEIPGLGKYKLTKSSRKSTVKKWAVYRSTSRINAFEKEQDAFNYLVDRIRSDIAKKTTELDKELKRFNKLLVDSEKMTFKEDDNPNPFGYSDNFLTWLKKSLHIDCENRQHVSEYSLRKTSSEDEYYYILCIGNELYANFGTKEQVINEIENIYADTIYDYDTWDYSSRVYDLLSDKECYIETCNPKVNIKIT